MIVFRHGLLAERTGPGETASNLSSVVRDKGVGAIRTNRPELIPQRHPSIDEKRNPIIPKPGDPMDRSQADREAEEADEHETSPTWKNDPANEVDDDLESH